jgi:hypothetical protein
MQLLRPIEDEIFKKAGLLIEGIESGKKSEQDIQSFYAWIDQYLAETYKAQFNCNITSVAL